MGRLGDAGRWAATPAGDARRWNPTGNTEGSSRGRASPAAPAHPPAPSSWSQRTLAIIGLGQIGGSFALAARPQVGRLLGLDRNSEAVEHARRAGWIDEGTSTDWSLLAEADAVMVAVPVGEIPGVLAAAAPHLRPGCLVSDAGSVKRPVVEAAARILPSRVAFVGGHPMAGTERSGPEAVNPALFQGATWVLTPCPPWGDQPVAPWEALLREMGARVRCLDPGEHDRHVALTSHLPLMLAVALTRVAAAAAPELPHLAPLVAGGFRDTTRVAGGEPAVGADILSCNADQLRPWLEALRTELARLEETAGRHDRDALRRWLHEARHFRSRLLDRQEASSPTRWKNAAGPAAARGTADLPAGAGGGSAGEVTPEPRADSDGPARGFP